MTRPTIVPSVIVLALALSSCASLEALSPFADVAASPVAEPSMLSAAGPTDIEGAIELAKTQRGSGDYDGATATLSQLVLLAPDDPRVLGEYGKTLVDRGETNDALAFLQRAIELNPGDWSFYSAQGVALAQTGNFGASQTAFSRALALKPNDPVILNNFALAHLQAGNLDQAEALLLRASLSGPAVPKITQNLALVRQLRTTAQQGTPAAAPVAPPAAPAVPEAVASDFGPVQAVEAPIEVAEIEAIPALETSTPNSIPLSELVVSESSAAQFTEEPVEAAEAEPAPVQEPVELAQAPIAAPASVMPAVAAPTPISPVVAAPTPFTADAAPSEASVAEIAEEAPEPVVENSVIQSVALDEPDSDSEIATADIWMPESGPIYLHLGAFASKDNAVRLFEKLESMGPQVALGYSGEQPIHSVSVGPYADRTEAISALGVLKGFDITEAQGVSSPIGQVLTVAELAEEAPAMALSVEPEVETEAEPEEAPEAPPALRFSETQ